MNRSKIIRELGLPRLSVLVVLASLTLLLTPSNAKAGCGYDYKASPKTTTPAGTLPATLPKSSDEENYKGLVSIVGLWNVVYTAEYTTPPFPAPPFQFLESYKTWHGDGTEFENAFLGPEGGNICFGVWKEIGKACVKLHHIGLMFASDGSISNVFTVDETDTVAPNGKTYAGEFDFKLFDNADFLGTGTPIAEVQGKTAATRITVD
ncbi:MAG: hypothetical protein WA823_04850 [Candidatus Acidiferrales bacterium]